MRHILFCLLIGAVAFTGCEKEPPPPPPEQAPPPPSPEQIYGEIKPILQPFYTCMTEVKFLTDADREGVLKSLREAKMKQSGVENGRIALGKIAIDIEDLVRQARDQERWAVVKGAIMASDVLKPGVLAPDGRYASLMARAELMLARPKVEVTGFITVDNDLYTFVRVTEKVTEKVETFKVREGEEFFEPVDPKTKQKKPAVLRLVRVIGDQQAVEFLYVPANDTWEVKGPRES